MGKLYYFSLTTLLILGSKYAYAQNHNEIKKNFNLAEYFFAKKNYKKSLYHINEIDKQPKTQLNNNPDFNFIAGASYWLSDTSKLKAIPYLEDYLKQSKTEVEVIFWLAKLYHANNKYEMAKEKYQEYAGIIKADEQLKSEIKTKILNEINRSIISCEYGKMLSIITSESRVDNLGNSVNTEFNEYAPVLNKSETEIYFTRKGPYNIGNQTNVKEEYFEDIYHSKILSGSILSRDSIKHSGFINITDSMKFSLSKNIGESINTPMHDAAIQLSHNDEHLYIYKNNHVWLSEIDENKKISVPHQITDLNNILNLGSYEPSISINNKEDKIYFASERSGGYGGLDLYKTIKVNGIWQAAVNLGPNINTEYDEDSPYIDPNDSTLYFSSKGHTSMGGYDVFKTTLIDSIWTYPNNMGHPVNSNSDDIFFVMLNKYNRAYFSSDRVGGKGKMDLYRISFAQERKQLAEISGKVMKGDKFLAAKSKVTIIDKLNDKSIAQYQSDSITGDYHILLDHNDKYIVKIETEGFRAYVRTFNIPQQEDYYSFYQEIHHVHLKDKNGNIIGHIVNVYGSKTNSLSSQNPVESEAYLYITKDSLMRLIENDTALFTTYTKNTKLFFISKDSYSLVDSLLTDFKDLKIQTNIKKQKDFLTKTKSNKQVYKNAIESNIIFYFPVNSFALNKTQLDSIKSYFGKIYKKKKIPLIRIEGHTDTRGTQEHNQVLSARRAKAVETAIKANHKLLKNMELIAMDERKLVVSEADENELADEIGRQLNRRVEITILVE